MTTPKALARTAGLLYLIVAVGGTFAVFYVGSRIVVPHDPAATADNIRASATLYRAGIVSNLVAATCFLLTAMALYRLLRHVNRFVAAAMVVFVAVSVAVACVNLISQYTALAIATSDEYPGALGGAGADALTLLFADGGSSAGDVSAVFFGLWLLPLGFLVARSGYFPTALGVLLVVGGFGYFTSLGIQFLPAGLRGGLALVPAAAGALPELVFIGWLLVRGVRTPVPAAPETLAPAAPVGA